MIRRQPLTIEFTVLPNSGKTTLIHNLANENTTNVIGDGVITVEYVENLKTYIDNTGRSRSIFPTAIIRVLINYRGL